MSQAKPVNFKDYLPQTINGKRVASGEYRSWQMMKNRCCNPNAMDYAYYGARGIIVCPSWMLFENFFADMGPKPYELATLDRVDSEGNYCKENCVWASRLAQSRNRAYAAKINGKHTWEWAEELNIATKTFHWRLYRFRKGEIAESELYRVSDLCQRTQR